MDEEQATDTIIKDHLRRLPKEIREVVEFSGWEEKLIEIGKKNGLHIDQIGVLQNETMFVLIGLAQPSEYIHNIQIHLNIVAPKAEAIAKEAEETIFKDIRNQLQETYNRDAIEAEVAEKEISGSENATLEKTGIHVEDGGSRVPINSPIPTEDRNELLHEVEHPESIPVPQPPPRRDAFASKLTDTFTIPKKTTDTTLPSVTPASTPPKAPGTDPYLEPLE